MTNNELRRRKLKDTSNGNYAALKKKKTSKSATTDLQRSFLCLILSGTILTVFVLLYTDSIPWHLGHRAIDQIAVKFGYQNPLHAVIIDAGSTGSRVLAFTFHISFTGGQLILDKELFKYLKPGLSSYAGDPQKGVESIMRLIADAKAEIPQSHWSKTPLVLKATAGLRLLPPEQYKELVDALSTAFGKLEFYTDDQSVEVMDGAEEGLFSWFTVNFLLDRLNAVEAVAALDLGGGSTQATFAAFDQKSLAQKEYIKQAQLPNGEVPVYVQSFLGLGLMAARKEIVTLNQPGKSNVTSECVNHIIKNRKLHFGGKDYFVSGPETGYPTVTDKGSSFSVKQEVPVVDFQKCSKIVTDYVTTHATPPLELPSKKIFAFSYYFDRAIEVGLIDEAKGGRVTVDDYKKAAKKSCAYANADQPFMCFDLTFIWVLLEKGLGLKGDTTLNLFKKINGHEVSWALGAAYDKLKSMEPTRAA